ncbi:BA75_00162T0 [Komagataella pastoris]|uniref:arginine--tRNA ligase n=1 Tax=Komagataella pastoris TaxID=4922 RepID=A0A1B2J5C8_PICPA|nr:BA75_00162T0 [Komagataella pastoris]
MLIKLPYCHLIKRAFATKVVTPRIAPRYRPKMLGSVESLTENLNTLSLKLPEVSIQGSFPESNPVDLLRNYITQELSKISGVDKDLIFPALEWGTTLEKGDLLIPVPRLRIKGANPKDLAEKWAAAFPKGGYLKDVIAQGPFLQFFFNTSVLYKLVISDALERGDDFGALPLGKGQKVIVEFSSPNIAKPFHAGHLRSTIIGGFISNLYEKLGHEVIRMNYLGDWGKQFGVLAVGFERYGDEAKLKTDPINHLFEVYVKINQDIKAQSESTEEIAEGQSLDDQARAFFKKMENGDESALSLWKRFRELSIEKYIDTYARLNIKYDLYSGESQVPQEIMDEATKIFEEKGLVTEDQGAKLIDLTKFNKKLGKAIVQKKDGTSLYLTRDVGAAIDRYRKYKFDKMIYVIASQQDLHTAQFFEILKRMDFEWAKNLTHINFGMVLGMSSRRGTVVFLDNILEETKEKMHDVMRKNDSKYQQIANPEEVADLVGISAVMIQDMQSKRINNYEFKWERMTSFEGDTGPYLQYAHSRLASITRNADIDLAELPGADFGLLVEPQAEYLIRLLAQYPDVLRTSLKNHEPSTLVTYLFKLTHQVSSCYDVLWVAGQEKPLATARLALYASARQILYNGMLLLGLTPVERM